MKFVRVFAVFVFLFFSHQLLVFGGGAREEGGIPDEQVLRVAVATVLGEGILNPVPQAPSMATRIVGPALDTLVKQDLDGNPSPNIATEWYSNEDFTEWTIHLRDDVYFHDWGEVTGEVLTRDDRRLTAEDVQFTIERFLVPDAVDNPAINMRLRLNPVFRIVDDFTLEIHIDESFPSFVEFTFLGGENGVSGMITSKKYHEAVGDEGLWEHPIGTGRWKFVEFNRGDSIVYDAVDEHWSGIVPGFDRLVLMEVPEEGARVAMLRRGEADLIDVGIDRGMSLADEGYELAVVEHTFHTSLQLYGTWRDELVDTNHPLSHRDVREALSLAIDRHAINDTLFSGLFSVERAFPGLFTGASGLGVDVEAFEEWSREHYRYDPDRARELIAEAGFSDGFEVTVWSYTHARAPWQPELWEVIASYWAEVGVTVNIEQTDRGAHVSPMIGQNPHPPELLGTMTMHPNSTTPFPMARFNSAYGSIRYRLVDQNNQRYLDLVDRVNTELDPVVRQRYFQEASFTFGEEFVSPKFWSGASVYVLSDKIGDWATIDGVNLPSMWVDYFQPSSSQ